eukprot:Pgem_evm1s18384
MNFSTVSLVVLATIFNSAAACTYTSNFYGQKLNKEKSANTWNACYDDCLNDGECRAFKYNDKKRKCVTYQYNYLESVDLFDAVNVLDLSCLVRHCTKDKDNFVGTKTNDFKDVATEYDCLVKCMEDREYRKNVWPANQEDAKCVGYVYNPSKQKCKIYRNDDNHQGEFIDKDFKKYKKGNCPLEN